MSRTRVLVIGGGISGLAAAHRLSGHGAAVTLLEGGDELGGLGTFAEVDDHVVERFYHCIMPTDDHLLSLLSDLGLADSVRWRSTRMAFAVDGVRYPFNTPTDLLRFRPLSPANRVRLGAVSLMLRHLGKHRDLDSVRTEDWLRGLYGDALWEGVWEPLFRSKFGSAVGDVPALYLWERLGRERNVSVRGYPDGGYKAIVDGLRRAIEARGSTVRTSASVQSMREADETIGVQLASGETFDADWVVSTVPLPLLHQMADPSLRVKLPPSNLQYQGVVNALLFLRRPLDGAYWTPVLASNTDFDGVVEMSSLAGSARYGGMHLAYLMKYTDRRTSLFQEDAEAIAARWSEQFVSLYSDLGMSHDDISAVRVFKAPFVEPTYPLGYSRLKPPCHVDGARLSLATTAHIYPRVTSWNSSVGLANEVVDHLWSLREQAATHVPLAP